MTKAKSVKRWGKPPRSKLWKLSDEEFKDLVLKSESYAGVAKLAGLSTGSPTIVVRKRIAVLGLDISHFVKTKGRTNGKSKVCLEDILRSNSGKTSGQVRRAFLLLNSVPYVCKECGQEPIWRGEKLTLILDHVDGDKTNHSPENLRWLCPCCNSQTETFCGRNIGRKKNSE